MFSYELKRGTLTVWLSGELDHSMAARVRQEIESPMYSTRGAVTFSVCSSHMRSHSKVSSGV